MEKQVKNIYYVGIETAGAETGKKMCHNDRPALGMLYASKKELPIYKQTRLLPYGGGRLQIYFTLLPKKLLTKKTLLKRNSWEARIMYTVKKAQLLLGDEGCEDIVFAKELSERIGEEKQIPMELYAVCLKQAREQLGYGKLQGERKESKIRKKLTAESLAISLPEDFGPISEESLIALLSPYLARINSIVFCGDETESAGRIEDYLYEEYGILTSYGKRPEKSTIWLDLNENTDLGLARYASENDVYHLNRAEVLKFLDTIVKNGYNTEVN